MSSKTRLFQRIPCDGGGFVVRPDSTFALIQVVNLSRNGACLRLELEDWENIENLENIDGEIEVQGQPFRFTGRICWSAAEGMRTRFGVEFLHSDQEVLVEVLERISLQEPETDPGPSFVL